MIIEFKNPMDYYRVLKLIENNDLDGLRVFLMKKLGRWLPRIMYAESQNGTFIIVFNRSLPFSRRKIVIGG